jgi:hypothetical protein
MRIPNKFNGYSADNRRLYNMGGGGGPNTTYSQTSNIPDYARPYVEQMLGATQRQLFTGQTDAGGKFTPTGFNNYMPYGATYNGRDAQGNPIYTNTAMDQARAAVAPQGIGQQQAANTINQYVAPTQTSGATSIAGDVAGRSAASGYYSPLQAERFLMGAPQQVAASRVRTDSFTSPYVSQGYMSPYMQNVVNAQQREARRAGDIQRSQNQAQAVNAGAFGGSRQAIIEAERQRNLSTQLGDIQAQGLQSAYQQGMGQFNAEQAAYLQAQQANQQAGLQAQTANQQANMQRAIQNMQSQQAAQAAQEASRQFGANLGLQGYGQTLSAANLLGQMGQQEYQQDLSTIQAMNQLGAQDQAYQQSIINQDIQNFGTAQQYPLMQLGVMSNMLRGLPMQSSTTNMYQAQPSFASQAAGALGTGLGLYQQGQTAKLWGQKEGGVVKMASGGIATGMSAGELGAKLKGPRFNDEALQQKANDPQTDQATKDLVAAEIARRANLRAGMAGGGIVAFKDGESVEDEEKRRAIRGEKRDELKRLREDAKSDEKFDEDMLVRAEKELRDARISRDLQPAPAAAPVDNEGIIAAARQNVSPVPTAPAPAQDVPVGGNQGIAAALQGKAALYGDAGYGGYQEGETSSLDASQLALLGLTRDIETEKAGLKTKMDQATTDLTKQYKKERTDAGIPDIFQVEKQKLEERKTRGEKSEQETARNNLIRFLTKWGTIPGSTMRGMIGAGAELIDKIDMDAKHKQKFLNELDDIDSRINDSEYARRIGDEDRARKEKDEAGKRYYQLAHDLNKTRLDIALKDKDLQRALEVQFAKNEAVLAKQTNIPAVIQEVQIKSAALMEKYAGPLRDGKMTKNQIADMALDEVLSKQPSVTSTAMTLPARNISAGADLTRAGTGEKDAATRASDAKRKQLGDFKDDLYDALRDKDIKKELNNAKTPEAKADIKNRVKKQVLGGFDLLTPRDVGLGESTTPPPATNRTNTIAPPPGFRAD